MEELLSNFPTRDLDEPVTEEYHRPATPGCGPSWLSCAGVEETHRARNGEESAGRAARTDTVRGRMPIHRWQRTA